MIPILGVTSKVEACAQRTTPYPFTSLGHAVTFWLLNPPNGLQAPSFWQFMQSEEEAQAFNPEMRYRVPYAPPTLGRDDDGWTDLDLWHKAARAIAQGLAEQSHGSARAMFLAYWSLSGPRPSVAELAKRFSYSEAHTKRLLRLTNESIAEVMRRCPYYLLQPKRWDA